VGSVSARQAGEFVEALLLAPVLRPIFGQASMLGDYEIGLFAESIAKNDRAFSAAMMPQLERLP
jgi:hypothetical protein